MAKPSSQAQDGGCYKTPWVDEIRDPDRGKFKHSMLHVACMQANNEEHEKSLCNVCWCNGGMLGDTNSLGKA